MYFYKSRGKQHLDLRGDLILSHNPEIVRARITSAAPAGVHNARYITIKQLSFWRKIKATLIAARFIWRESHTELTAKTIDGEGL